MRFIIYYILFLAILVSCSDNPTLEQEKNVFNPPSDYPEAVGLVGITINEHSIALGRMLFYDSILSNGGISCGTCHKQEFSFSDGGNLVSNGFEGRQTLRNTPPIINAIYSNIHLWDGSIEGSEALANVAFRVILLPNEFNADTNEIKSRLNNHKSYPQLFKNAFGNNSEIDARQATRAIAAFMATLISDKSPYDKYRRGNKEAMNESQIRGMDLFFSDRIKCSSCHSGVLFTDNQFHSTGLNTHYFDRGRFEFTGLDNDRGRFKTPTLRNIAVTFPYMHDGEIYSLRSVLEHYNKGGFHFINKDSRIVPLGLSRSDIDDLENFLNALTDESFLNNPAFSPIKK